VWVWLVLRSSRLLHTRPWQAFKVANLMLRLEVSTCQPHLALLPEVAPCSFTWIMITHDVFRAP
jgi:hypothetical protein